MRHAGPGRRLVQLRFGVPAQETVRGCPMMQLLPKLNPIQQYGSHDLGDDGMGLGEKERIEQGEEGNREG